MNIDLSHIYQALTDQLPQVNGVHFSGVVGDYDARQGRLNLKTCGKGIITVRHGHMHSMYDAVVSLLQREGFVVRNGIHGTHQLCKVWGDVASCWSDVFNNYRENDVEQLEHWKKHRPNFVMCNVLMPSDLFPEIDFYIMQQKLTHDSNCIEYFCNHAQRSDELIAQTHRGLFQENECL